MAGEEQPNGPRTHLLDSILPIIQRPTTPAAATAQYDPSHERSHGQPGRDRVDGVLAWKSLSEITRMQESFGILAGCKLSAKTMDKATS
jgi:hypothetical protein